MSDNWIIVIPESADYVPTIEAQQKATDLFRSFVPNADEVKAEATNEVRFIDCGVNLERILCPKCEAEIGIEWWQKQMDKEADIGFPLNLFVLSCCGTKETLATLQYEWPQGFARFSLEAMNPDEPDLTDEQVQALEFVLDCRVRKILQHI